MVEFISEEDVNKLKYVQESLKKDCLEKQGWNNTERYSGRLDD
ncbi:MAG: hypothetical protein ACLFS3_02620 [Candidatus Aenigmatarchaeota archaeon]